MREQTLCSLFSVCICVFIWLALTEVGHANLRRNPYGSCPAVVPLGSMSQKFIKDKVVNRRTNEMFMENKIMLNRKISFVQMQLQLFFSIFHLLKSQILKNVIKIKATQFLNISYLN